MYIELNNFDEAKALLNELLLNNNANIDALKDLAVIEIIEENYNNARSYISKVLSLDPNNEIANGNVEYIESLMPKNLNKQQL